MFPIGLSIAQSLLINVDLKLLTKVLALQVNSGIGDMIYIDQTGFMSNRQVSDNIRKVLNLIHLASFKNIPSLLLSVDISKAFDSLTWPYMMNILDK